MSSQTLADSINQIKTWFEKAVPAPTYANAHAQLSVHFEEIAEMVTALFLASHDDKSSEQLGLLLSVLDYSKRQVRSQEAGIHIDFDAIDRVAFLDALCDQIVTSIGLAHMLGMDIRGAIQEVAESNDSKFDDEGKPIFNEALKIIKGPNYFQPHLSRYA